MPAKTKTGAGKKKKKQKGKGFFGDVFNGIKKGFNFLKDNKVISGVASMIPHPASQSIAQGARLFGMGKGKKHKLRVAV